MAICFPNKPGSAIDTSLKALKQILGDAGKSTLVLAVVLVALSVLAAWQLSRQLALQVESAHVLGYARDVLRRNEQTSEQVTGGIKLLLKEAVPDPCSASGIDLMKQIDLASSNLQAIGRVVGNRLVCSSLGRHTPGLDLGPPDFITALGYQIRQHVVFPFAPGQSLAVVEWQGYAAILHKDLPVDVALAEADGLLGVFTGAERRLLMSRGALPERWAQHLREGWETVVVADGHLIAVLRSRTWSSGSMAALPVSYLDRRTRAFAWILLPAGLVTGVALALVALLLARRQRSLVTVMRSALRRHEFFLVYQPIVELETGKWVGAEALLRWRRSSGEMVPPDVFIQLAENNGLIGQVTEYVLQRVAREAGALLRSDAGFHLALNLSAFDMHSGRIVGLLDGLAAELQIEPNQLVLEVTERGFLQADLARAVVQTLRARGFQIAIDDFGTGYSSLSYLETFSVDSLKIDKSFIDKIGTESAASGVVSHIIGMAKSLRLAMVAEGVETQAQADYLRASGVQFAQGWLYSKPLPLDALKAGLLKAAASVDPV